MKNIKKLPTKQVEKFSTVFMQLGLVLVLFIVYVTLEHQTEVKPLALTDLSSVPEKVYFPEEPDVIFTKEPKEIPKMKIPEPNIFITDEPIEKGKKETIILKEPTDKKPIIFNDKTIIVVPDPEPEPENDVPFINIEDAPVFKGCEGLLKEENKICFEKKIRKFVQRNFDAELAQEIGLHTGKHNIYTQFIIDKDGKIADIKVRAPHKRLEKEAQRIIKKLPKFTPGMQRKKPVKVRYTLPIAFSVE
ncbi:MAG: energy transducer TonB [Polaribacter sp.]